MPPRLVPLFQVVEQVPKGEPRPRSDGVLCVLLQEGFIQLLRLLVVFREFGNACISVQGLRHERRGSIPLDHVIEIAFCIAQIAAPEENHPPFVLKFRRIPRDAGKLPDETGRPCIRFACVVQAEVADNHTGLDQLGQGIVFHLRQGLVVTGNCLRVVPTLEIQFPRLERCGVKLTGRSDREAARLLKIPGREGDIVFIAGDRSKGVIRAPRTVTPRVPHQGGGIFSLRLLLVTGPVKADSHIEPDICRHIE